MGQLIAGAVGRAARRLGAAGLVALTACGGAEPGRAIQVGGDRGFTILFPAPPRQQQGHEGPRVRSYLASAVDDDGRLFEVAVFTIARSLTATEQIGLMQRVLRGLAARSGGRAFEMVPTADAGGRTRCHSVTMELADQRRGRWLIFYGGSERMFQLSVVGPDDGELPRRSAAFFDSFALEPAAR